MEKNSFKLFSKYGVLSIVAASLVTAQAATFNASENAFVDVNGRLQLSALDFNQEYTPNQDGYRHSYLAITPYYKINKAYIGGTYVLRYTLDTNDNLAKGKNSKLSSSQYYVFIKSPNLGQTSIGKTSGILEDYFLGQQKFGISATNYLLLSKDVYHHGMWKYTSTKNRYYDYGFSFVHNAKADYGTYSQIAGNINWTFNLSENNKLKVVSLYSSQKQIVAQAVRYKSHPYSLGLHYSYADYVNLGVVGYKSHVRVANFSESTNVKTSQYGVIYSLAVKPLSYLTVYARYIYDKVDNKTNTATTTIQGNALAANNSYKTRIITTGINMDVLKYGFIYSDYSHILENPTNNAKTQSSYFVQTGFGVKF
ncbi:hypothetical protein [Psittacicella hinzii]|uniref:Porin domain-containing protein n=1 Tax=Psittacicella hinzii TaxID=2028575 RepID=A0A3A1YCF4_9GAMM|nr:hypothetical protein [Psittacicella hinzii]RIY34899.1 hypothetical protein CKF58_07425 [Psittacicella hinzii]